LCQFNFSTLRKKNYFLRIFGEEAISIQVIVLCKDLNLKWINLIVLDIQVTERAMTIIKEAICETEKGMVSDDVLGN